jgi:hypothetical protein
MGRGIHSAKPPKIFPKVAMLSDNQRREESQKGTDATPADTSPADTSTEDYFKKSDPKKDMMTTSTMPSCSGNLASQIRNKALEIDQFLRLNAVQFLSLSPHQEKPNSCESIITRLVHHLCTYEEAEALVECIATLVEATVQYFPGNLFWDFDCIAASMVTCAVLSAQDTAHYIREYGRKLDELFELYGKDSLISFQYTHDFLYGYDHERWHSRMVLDEPECYEFSGSYLDFLLRKGAAITRQIEREVPGFERVPPGEFRNTFGYARDAASEVRVLRAVVTEGQLPIRAWDFDGYLQRVEGRTYREARATIAARLTS